MFAQSDSVAKTDQIADIVGNFKLAISTGTLCMYDTLWDTFTVKVGE